MHSTGGCFCWIVFPRTGTRKAPRPDRYTDCDVQRNADVPHNRFRHRASDYCADDNCRQGAHQRFRWWLELRDFDERVEPEDLCLARCADAAWSRARGLACCACWCYEVGPTALGIAPADVVTGISGVNATALPIVHTLSASANARVSSHRRVVTYTITAGP